jgi:hypothetical protein
MDPGLTFDSAAAVGCLSAIEDASCTELQTGILACDEVFASGVPEGGACPIGSDDCIQRPDGGQVACVATPSGGCMGVCSAGPTLGLPCDIGVQACLQGFCSSGLGGDEAFCVPFLADGGACTMGGNQDGCDPSSEFCGAEGVCVPLIPTGAGCDETNGTLGGHCIGGDLCTPNEGADGVCLPNTALPVGSPCGPGDRCQGICLGGVCASTTASVGQPCDPLVICEDGTCDDPDGGVGVCVPNPTLGQPCSASMPCANSGGFGSFGVSLPDYLTCVDGICRSFPFVGESCETTGACAGGDYCDSQSICRPYGTPGQACDPHAQGPCLNGNCTASSICEGFKPVGAPCNPTDLDCSPLVGTVQPPDGGPAIQVDTACFAGPDGGPPVCQALVCPA